MKNHFFITLILPMLILTHAPALAQSNQPKIDSLKTLLKTADYDTNRVKIYDDLSWYYSGTRDKTDSARMFADSIKMLSEKLDFKPGISKAHFHYGVIDRHEGNYEKGLKHLNTYVSYSRNQGNTPREASGLFQIGVIHENLGNYEKSLNAYQRVLAIHKQNEFWYGVGFTLNGIGVIYKNLGKYDDAAEHYEQALAVFDSLTYKEDLTYVLSNMGNLYAEQENYEEALDYHQKSLAISRELGLDYISGSTLENIGNVYNKLQQYDQALPYQLKALTIRRGLAELKETAISLNQVGYTYLKRDANSQAERYLQEGLKLAQQINARPVIQNSYEYLAELYEQKNEYQRAFAYHKLFAATKDSILNKQTARQINEMQAKYETAQKNEEIATLSKENELRQAEAERRATWNRILIGGLILAAIIAGLIVFLLQQRHKNEKLIAAKNEEIKTARFKQQLSELEMKALRAQMNPHFIFNCMNSINRMILSEDSDNASRYLTKFSKLIRLMLENSEQPSVPLQDELAMLETYIQLEALRFKGKISYRISVDDSVDQENTLVPSLVLQPFIENAIWHGLMHKDGEGLINLSINEENDFLRCIIEDNGVGREKALELKEKTVMKQESMGLQITEERLQLLNSRELRELIRITDLKDSVNRALGTRVDISIPIA